MVATDSHPGAEVLEDNASPVVKRVYDDIKSTLRVPLVNLVFRKLALYPDFLTVAWRQVETNAKTVYFERRADAIRTLAVERMAGMGAAPSTPGDPAIHDALRVFHYANPKLLLVVAAIRAATNGQYPRLEELPNDQKRQIPTGVPADVTAPAMVDPASVSPEVAALFKDITSTLGIPVVNSDYRALAQWPDYLETAWGSLKPITQTPEYRRLQLELRLAAEETILVLPFRVEINPHIMRLIGLSEQDIDSVRDLLEMFHRLLPGLIANIAFLAAGALGAEAAARSPFPIEGVV